MNLDKANKILIIRLSSLGDVLLTTPLIRTLKNNFPKIEIDFLVRREYKDLLLNNPYISNLLVFERDNKLNARLKQEISIRKYDLVVDLQNNLRSCGITSRLKCPKLKFGKNRLNKFLLVKFKYNRFKPNRSIPTEYAATIDNFTLDEKGLDLFIPDNIITRIPKDKKVIGFCPGSRHYPVR